MAALPYTPNPSNVKRFLEHIRSAGVPSKVTVTYLEAVGFKSKNDRYIPGVLKAIGFVDETGTPTDKWRQFRDKNQGPVVLAQCLRSTYASLFEAFPDAPSREASTLHNFMSANTDAAGVTVDRMVGTFRALASMANFDSIPANPVAETANLGPLGPGTAPAMTIPDLSRAADPDAVQFVADGIVIKIKPTPENVRRAMRFLEIYAQELNHTAP